MQRAKILIVEDDLGLAITLKDFFEDNGLDVVYTADGGLGFCLYKEEAPNLILLDVMLPNKTGFEIIEEIRGCDYSTPIILMTGTEFSPEKQIKGYELGVINYIKKPIFPQAVLAQIRTILSIPLNIRSYQVGGNQITIHGQKVQIDKVSIKLREKDVLVLSILLDKQSQIVSRETILKYTWNNNKPELSNVLDGVISRLRKTLELYKGIQIMTVYGSGYIIQSKESI